MAKRARQRHGATESEAPRTGSRTVALPCGRTGLRRAEQFRLSEFRLRPGFASGLHAHDASGVVLVIEGGIEVRHGRGVESASRGVVLTLPAAARHAETSEEGSRCLLLQVVGEPRFEGVERLAHVVRAFPAPASDPIAHRLAGEMRDGPGKLPLEAAAAELLLEVHAASCITSTSGHPQWVRELAALLVDRRLDPPSLDELAATLDLTPEHIARAFRAATGCTIGDFHRRQRLLHAAASLREQRLPLVAVALDARYADQAHMTRQFRRYLGVTPGEYRARVCFSLGEPTWTENPKGIRA